MLRCTAAGVKKGSRPSNQGTAVFVVMKLIDRHILATFTPPFLFGLSVTTFLLMINVLQTYIELFLEKGIHVGVATEVLLLSLGHTVALTVPMATLIGVLMAVGHLAADQEITALKACGVSLYRISRPLLVIGFLLSVTMVAYNHYVLPEGNHRLRNRLFEIHQLRPTMEVKANIFAEISEEYTIFVRFKDDRTGELRDVVLYQREGRGDVAPDVVVARRGSLQALGPDRIRLELFDGEIHRIPDPEDPLTYNRTRFERQTFLMALDGGGPRLRRTDTRGEREMDLTMLAHAKAEQESLAAVKVRDARKMLDDVVQAAYLERDAVTAPAVANTRNALDEYWTWNNLTEARSRSLSLSAQVGQQHRIKAKKYAVEWHKKFSIPVACTVFVVLGVPLAVVSSRGGRGVSVGVSLLAFIVYYVFLSGGEKLADRGRIEPWIAMWSPNVVLGILGAFLLHRSVQETPTFQFGLPSRRKVRPPSARA